MKRINEIKNYLLRRQQSLHLEVSNQLTLILKAGLVEYISMKKMNLEIP